MRRLIGIARALLHGTLLCALAACGGGGGSGAPAPNLQAIAVTPLDRSIAIGQTVQFAATGAYSDGSFRDLTAQVNWSSTQVAVADISAGGLASGKSGGATTIGAALSGIAGSATLNIAPPIPGNVTVWNFDNAADRLAASIGPAQLAYRDPNGTGWGPQLTSFAKAGALGLPPLNGEDTDVMSYPATTPEQGYTLTHHSAANGVFATFGAVSNYTVVMDLYLPPDNGNWRALLQTNDANNDDADLFVHALVSGNLGVGVNSYYNDYYSMAPGSWHRVAIVVQCGLAPGGTGQIYKYIDGLFVGGQYTDPVNNDYTHCRWGLGDKLDLFTDNDGETAAGYVSSILYVDRQMFPAEIRALGGPSAAGANVPGAAVPAPPQVASRRVKVFAHRTNSGHAPENTLAGINALFNDGADYFECDIHKTSDGQLVLRHDDDMARTTAYAATGSVDSYDLATLQSFDVGTWFDPQFASERVPTLVQALNAAKGKGRVLLDIKLPYIGQDIAKALQDAGVDDSAVWPSQQNNTDAVAQDFKTYLPNSGMLWGEVPTTLDDATFQHLRDLNVVGFDVHYTDITPEFIAWAHDPNHAFNMMVVVWTILDPDTMLSVIAQGVDGMETDYPAVLNSLMPAPLN